MPTSPRDRTSSQKCCEEGVENAGRLFCFPDYSFLVPASLPTFCRVQEPREKMKPKPLPWQPLHPRGTLGLRSTFHIVGLTGPGWPSAGMELDFPKWRIVDMAQIGPLHPHKHGGHRLCFYPPKIRFPPWNLAPL